jgi:pyruvate-ferredoxin/flavodoxin oxidoreductase
VKIIGDNTDKYCQAYFHTTLKNPVDLLVLTFVLVTRRFVSTYLVNTPNFVACHVQAYLKMYDVTRGLRENGTFLLNTVWSAEELEKHLPNRVKRYFAIEKYYGILYQRDTDRIRNWLR